MGLDNNGYQRPTYDDIVKAKILKAQELFGADIDTDEKTAFGKFIRIGAYDLAKAYEDIENVYYARFPNTATGDSLDRLCVFAGITRNPATYAQHIVTVYGTAGTKVEMGKLVLRSGDVTFYNIKEFEIKAPATTKNGETADPCVEVTLECSEPGEVGNIEKISELVNIIEGVKDVKSGVKSLTKNGEDAETDLALRKRFAAAIEGAGSSNENAIRAALMRVPKVQSAGIVVNATDETVDGRPPRTFECYVHVPGWEKIPSVEKSILEQEIAETIFEKAPVGIKTCRTGTSGVDKTVYDQGGHPHIIQFSKTEEVKVFVQIAVAADARFEEKGPDQIKSAIMTYINGLGVGNDVVLSALYGHIHSINGVVEVTGLKLKTEGDSEYKAESITIGEVAIAVTTANEIEVTIENETVQL